MPVDLFRIQCCAQICHCCAFSAPRRSLTMPAAKTAPRSRKAAQECSPRRKPWESWTDEGSAPAGRKNSHFIAGKRNRRTKKPGPKSVPAFSWLVARINLSCLAGVSEAGACWRNPERSEGSLSHPMRFFAAAPSNPAPGSGCSTSASRSAAKQTAESPPQTGL